MARAMRASTFLKPNAMRVRSLILVLVDSIRALERPWCSVASMLVRWRTILRARSTKLGMRQRRAQESHRSRASLPSWPLTAKT
jgi:hypothetical protein